MYHYRLYFIKMHSIGNDFIIVYNNNNIFTSNLIKNLSNRKNGIGFDQMILVKNFNNKTNIDIVIYNSDGSVAEMCGNGIRCVGMFAMKKYSINEVIINAGLNSVKCYMENDGMVSFNIGKPKTLWHQIPLAFECDVFSLPLVLNGMDRSMCVSFGNPHVVFFTKTDKSELIDTIGPIVECNSLFPNKTNVHIAYIENNKNINVSTWERGVGRADSCGSGACAVAYLANKFYECEDEININFKNGTMLLSIDKNDNISNKADAFLVFNGSVSLDLINEQILQDFNCIESAID